jgi:tetratricopeptide (TPR) repeat protein
MAVILLALGSAIVIPPVATGLGVLSTADRAMKGKDYPFAAASYGRASQFLPWRTDLWEKAGNAEFLAGEYQRAIAQLRKAAEEGPLSARGWDELGSSYWQTGGRDSAVSSWLEGARAHSQNPALLDRLAGAYEQSGDYAAEISILERRLQLGDDAGAHYRLGLLILVSDPAAAAEQLGSAASMDDQYAPAVRTLQQAVRVASAEGDPARGVVVLGRGLALVQEWDLARLAFERAAGIDPSNAEAWAWLGEAKQQTGQGGAGELDRALQLDPRDSVVHILRGLYFRRNDEDARAVSEYSRAAALDPKNPAIQASLGEALAANGDLAAALSAYQHATQLSPDGATYWRLLALFCADNDVQVMQLGLPAAQRAAQIAPKDSQVLDALGWSFAQAGYFDQAEAALRRAVDAAPGTAYPHVHLAILYLRLSERNNALDQLNLALQVEPSGAAADSARQLLKQYFPSAAAPAVP